MTRFLSILASTALLATASLASANSGQLAQVSVHQASSSTADCTPPNDAKPCADFHAAIREHFSKREIGMLFGAATAYPEYRSTFDRTRAKYAAFLRDEGGVAVASR